MHPLTMTPPSFISVGYSLVQISNEIM